MTNDYWYRTANWHYKQARSAGKKAIDAVARGDGAAARELATHAAYLVHVAERDLQRARLSGVA